MATYKIDTNRAADSADALHRVGRDLDKIHSQLGSIRGSMNSVSTAITGMKLRVRLVEKDVLDLAVSADSLAEALAAIVTYYTDTERMILAGPGQGPDSNNNVADDAQSWIQQILDQIKQWLMGLGILEEPGDPNDPKVQEKEHDKYMRSQIDNVLDRDRFKKSTWKKASVEERKKILNEFLQQVAGIMGIPIGQINFFYSESRTEGGNTYYTLGSYNPGRHQVSINEWVLEQSNLNSYSLMKTIVHEMRHAYQHAACQNPEAFNVSPETIAQWQDSFDNYRSSTDFQNDFGMSPSDAHQAYKDQAVERDAREFAGQS